MNEVYASIVKLCQTFLVTEIICSLFPGEKSLKWCLNIITVYIFLSLILNIGGVNFDFDFTSKEVLKEYNTENVYLNETERILTKKIKNSLDSVLVEYESIEPILNITESDEVKLNKIIVKLKYKSDRERARAVIKALVNSPYDFDIEVISDG